MFVPDNFFLRQKGVSAPIDPDRTDLGYSPRIMFNTSDCDD